MTTDRDILAPVAVRLLKPRQTQELNLPPLTSHQTTQSVMALPLDRNVKQLVELTDLRAEMLKEDSERIDVPREREFKERTLLIERSLLSENKTLTCI